ncbi:MAG: PQQ-binding-like beta-propeller repeat protein, partial [Bacteroidota bacterium]
MRAFLLFSSLFIFQFLHGQGWERHFDDGGDESGIALAQTPDGGFIIAASTGDLPYDSLWVIKTDADGFLQWQRKFGSSGGMVAMDVLNHSDKGFYVLANTYSTHTHLLRLDEQGNELWRKTEWGQGVRLFFAPDGDLLLCGSVFPDGLLRKVDADNGNQLWWVTFDNPDDLSIKGLAWASDGGFVVAGSGYNGPFTDYFAAKVSAAGSLQWSKFYGTDIYDFGQSITPALDGGYWLSGTTGFGGLQPMLVKIDENGEELSSQILSVFGSNASMVDMIQAGNDAYLLTGGMNSDLLAAKLDANLQVIWSETYGDDDGEFGNRVIQTSEGGFAISGHSNETLGANRDVYLVKLDAGGLLYTNALQGSVRLDPQADCQDDPAEAAFPNLLVRATSDKPFYDKTADSGSYAISADSGAFTVEVLPPSVYWEVCGGSKNASLASFDTATLDFQLRKLADCPYLTASLSTSFLRRCFESTYSVAWCNHGTVAAENATVEIVLDEHLEFLEAEAPLLSQSGDVYTFSLGNIEPGECGNFKLWVKVSCDVPLGTEHCTTMHLFPDTLCLPDVDAAFQTRHCQPNQGAFDPNDKRALVGGRMGLETVLPNQAIEYLVRFQNTGTDTAFNVVIRDTLSPLLDPATFRPGASSHSYTWEISGEGILRFEFKNILLPDSNVNESASHGFVQFSIGQKADLPIGSALKNSAAIYFDFNAAVITNVAKLTVDDKSEI